MNRKTRRSNRLWRAEMQRRLDVVASLYPDATPEQRLKVAAASSGVATGDIDEVLEFFANTDTPIALLADHWNAIIDELQKLEPEDEAEAELERRKP